jgi:hypothetical protein
MAPAGIAHRLFLRRERDAGLGPTSVPWRERDQPHVPAAFVEPRLHISGDDIYRVIAILTLLNASCPRR